MNEIYSRLGWSLTEIYFASFLPIPVKIFEAPATLPLSLVAAPKTNHGTGGNAWIIKILGNTEACLLRARWLLLILARPRLSKKVSIPPALFFPSFSPPLENVLHSFIGLTSQSPSYLVPVYFVAPLMCLPTCTVLYVHAGRHARCILACFWSHGYTWLPPPHPLKKKERWNKVIPTNRKNGPFPQTHDQ